MGFSIGGLIGSNSSAKKAATVAWERQKEVLQNQHQWEMKDLEKAGLNPALTLGDIGGSGGASVGQAQVNGGSDSVMGLINSAVSAYTAKKNAETGDTQGQLNLAQAANTIAKTKGYPQELKNDTIRALASQTQANATASLIPSQIAESESRTKQNQQGWLGKVAGTENYDKAKKWLPFISATIPGAGAGYKGYKFLKSINSARKFGKGLWR